MTAPLRITGYAVAGTGAESAPPHRRVALPRPGTSRRGGRLSLLAVDLARCAAGGEQTDETTAVLFGTGLGCLTETALFVEHMIRAEEATPKPRAFTASVHNAIASKVALDLQARGECQTFSQGAASFGQAVFAAAMVRARGEEPILLGALDEDSGYVARGLAACGREVPVGEGGAVLCCGSGAALAVLRPLAMGRPEHPGRWLESRLPAGAAVVHVADFDGDPAPFPAVHPSLTATAAALAAGILAGEVDPGCLGVSFGHGADRSAGIAVVTRSRFGDLTALHLEAP